MPHFHMQILEQTTILFIRSKINALVKDFCKTWSDPLIIKKIRLVQIGLRPKIIEG